MTSPFPSYLTQVIRQAMTARGFRTAFPAAALDQANHTVEPTMAKNGLKDLTGWLWSSIDNDDSRDLDQVEYAVADPRGIRVYVGIACIPCYVAKGSPLDQTARQNTTSIYTGIETFPMLPERLSTNLSSLLEGQIRPAFVIEMLIDANGQVTESSVYRALLKNQAQLAYTGVAQWLSDHGFPTPGPLPASEVTPRVLAKINASPELQQQLQLQMKAAKALRARRHAAGALSLQTGEFRAIVLENGSFELQTHDVTPATQLIEDFMIAANQAVDDFLSNRNMPILQRVVRTPKRWDRIVQLAAPYGTSLPGQPDVRALEVFLADRHQKDPDHFPDLSLAVVKLLGRGEYLVSRPGQSSSGHFGLAVKNYLHSTAPNRRYPDVITQRLLEAAFANQSCPYSLEELDSLAAHCTEREDEANKVERFGRKCIAALALLHRIGQEFEGYITGASDKGTWVRLKRPPVEGRLEGDVTGLDVGDRVLVRLTLADPQHGYIDFQPVRRLERFQR